MDRDMHISNTTFVCMKWRPNLPKDSGYYQSQLFTGWHVDLLHRMLRSFVSAEVDLLCITDDTSDLPLGVRACDIPEDLIQLDHLPKLALYDTQVNKKFRDYVIYMDLDVVVTGNFFKLMPDPSPISIFAPEHRRLFGTRLLDSRLPLGSMIRRIPKSKIDEKRILSEQPINSSIVCFKCGSLSWIKEQFDYDKYVVTKKRLEARGHVGTDQLYLSSLLDQIPSWMPLGPKEGMYTPHPRQITFHLLPRNHTVLVFPGKGRNPWQLSEKRGYGYLKSYYRMLNLE